MQSQVNVAIVTGGSRGIGAATARTLAEQGYAVCVNYSASRSEAESVVAAVTQRGGTAHLYKADVTDPHQVERLFDFADRLGSLRALVNSAGITGTISPLADAEPATLQRVMDVNVMGVMLCSRQAVLRMSTRRGGQGGAIVNVSSAASTLGSPGEYVWYAASKGAVDSFTLGFSKEVGGEGIRVNAVSPGLIDTQIHAAAGDADRARRLATSVPMQRVGDAEEVARTIGWLLSEQSSYTTGAIVRVAGGR